MNTHINKTPRMSAVSPIFAVAKLTLLIVLGLGISGCDKGTEKAVSDTAKSAEKTVGDAAKSTGKAVGDAAKSAGEVVGDATDAVGDAAKDVGKKLSEGFSSAVDKASSTLKDIDGGSDMLTKVKDLFGSVEESLRGISDKASAEIAASKLGDLSGTVDSLSEWASKLPGTAKVAVSSVVNQGLKQLEKLSEKFSDMTGVEDVIKPKLDELIKKLSNITGE